MSALIIYKRKNKLYMASDTATSVEQNGLHYRVNDIAKKLYVVDNQLIWCTGILNIAYKIMEEYKRSYNHNIENLSLTAKKYSKNLTHIGSNRIIIYIAEYRGGEITLHNLFSDNNFEIVSMPLSNDPEEVTLYTAGAKSEEAFKFAYNKVMENDSPTYVFEHTMDYISLKEPEMIGGYCKSYELSSNGIKKIMDSKIRENKNTRYFQIVGSAPSSTYTGGFLKLYNGDVTKERVEIGTYSANDMGVINIKSGSGSSIIELNGNDNGGAVNLNNNNSCNIVELSGNDKGGTINLRNSKQDLKVHISSMDSDLNHSIVQLNGEDNNAKLTLKARSETDNMSDFVPGDRKTGGFIEFKSYDDQHKYFITVNNENNFGMYDTLGSAFEINSNVKGVIINHQNESTITLSDGGIRFLVDNRNKLRVVQGTIDTHTGSIKDQIDFSIPCVVCAGSTNFGSTNGTTIPFDKDLGNTNYIARITPNSDPNGYVGEIWYTKSTSGFTVYNSGSATSQFDYIVLAY